MHLGFNQQKGLSGSSFFWHQPQLDVLQFVFFLYQAWALGQRIQLKPWILQSWWTGNRTSQRWLHVWKKQLWRRLPNQNQRVQVEKNLVVTPSLPLSRNLQQQSRRWSPWPSLLHWMVVVTKRLRTSVCTYVTLFSYAWLVMRHYCISVSMFWFDLRITRLGPFPIPAKSDELSFLGIFNAV